MASSIGEKVRLISLVTIHSLLNKQIDKNSVGAHEQHIRDLEGATENLEGEVAMRVGRVGRLGSEVGNIKIRIDEVDRSITTVLTNSDTTDDFKAVPLQKRLRELRRQVESLEKELEDEKSLVASFTTAAEGMKSKHAEMMAELRELQSLQRETEAKEEATRVMKQVGGAMGRAGAGAGVDSAKRRLNERSDRATAGFDRAVGGLKDTVGEDVEDIAAREEIAERMRKIHGDTAAK